ncbi:OsmC family protein [Nannocystaceae bacterium ST9]
MSDDPHQSFATVRGSASGFAQTIKVGEHNLIGDEPRDLGGEDTGPNPYDYLLASLGSCTSMTLGLYARKRGWPLESVEVRLRHTKLHAEDCQDCETKTGMIDHIDRNITLVGALDDEQRAKLLAIADRCPVHRTLKSEIDIVTRLV